MMMSTFDRWKLRLTTFLLAALAAASATFWGLKLTLPAAPLQGAAVAPPGAAPSDDQAWVRLLGDPKAGASPATAQAPDLPSSRFKLLGVVAGLHRQGYALIAADGQAAKPYRVGDQVENGLRLKSVAPRSAELVSTLNASTRLTLELPPLTP